MSLSRVNYFQTTADFFRVGRFAFCELERMRGVVDKCVVFFSGKCENLFAPLLFPLRVWNFPNFFQSIFYGQDEIAIVILFDAAS